MRICILARGIPDEKSPCNGIYEWGLATTLAQAGHEVLVLAVDLRVGKKRDRLGLQKFVKENIEVWRMNIPTGKIGKNLSIKIRLFFCKKYYKILKKEGRIPDLTWAFFGRTFGNIAYNLYKDFGVFYAITEYEGRLFLKNITTKNREKLSFIYKNAVARTAPNIAFCEKMQKNFGIEFSYLPPIISKNCRKKEHKGFVFVSIGALTEEKGMDIVIRAFSKVKKYRKDTSLLIVGTGDEKRALKEEAIELGVGDCVSFVDTGKCNLGEIMAGSDCFVLASRKELFGTIYLVALATGIPVVTTDCFAPKGLIDARVGKVVKVDDTEEFANAMKEACSSFSPYKSEDIIKFAKENFSANAVINKISEILKEGKSCFLKTDLQ